MWEEFKGRTAVVTGGSEGIGQDFVRILCEAGCETYFCSRTAEKGQAVAKALGPHAHYFQTDLGSPEQIQAFAAHLRERAGSVDYLVNNAANDDRIAFRDITVEDCDRMWHLNLRSYLLTARAFLGAEAAHLDLHHARPDFSGQRVHSLVHPGQRILSRGRGRRRPLTGLGGHRDGDKKGREQRHKHRGPFDAVLHSPRLCAGAEGRDYALLARAA